MRTLLFLLLSFPAFAALSGGGFVGPFDGLQNRLHRVTTSSACLPDAYTDWAPYVTYEGTADSTRFGLLPNEGAASSSYGLALPGLAGAASNGPKYRTSANCNGAPFGCAEFDRAGDYLTMPAALSESWTSNVQCIVAYFPGNAVDYVYVTKDNESFFEYNLSKGGYRYSSTGFVRSSVISGSAGWHAICADLTTANGPVAVDGTEVLADLNLPVVQPDPARITLANFNSYNGGDAIGLQLGRLLFFNVDPGKTVAELSACLAADWGI